MKLNKHILFLSTLSLATNPRLVKEIELAEQNHFKVSVISFEFDNWSKNYNDILRKNFSHVNFITIPTTRRHFGLWFYNSFKTKLFRLLSNFFSISLRQKSQLISNRSEKIIKFLKFVNNVDLVIGHNPGAIYPTLFAAKKYNCASGFDVEDYHSGEGNNLKISLFTKNLMNYCLPKFNYVSFASNLIQQKVQQDILFSPANWFSILNFFKSNDFVSKLKTNNSALKLVWFSQNITYGRGLEEILVIFSSKNYGFELHLYGFLDNVFYKEHILGKFNVYIHGIVSQIELNKVLSLYDVGLALDMPVDENRNLAITNKIIAYLQSGLYILASNIASHSFILEKYPKHGVLSAMDPDSIIYTLRKIQIDISSIRSSHVSRFESMKSFSWESESLRLFEVWKMLLH